MSCSCSWWQWWSGGGGDGDGDVVVVMMQLMVVVIQLWWCWWCVVVMVMLMCGRGGDLVVVVVVGDFFWRSSLLFKTFIVVASSCLSVHILRAEHFFVFDWCLHHRKLCRLSYLLCAGFWWADYFCFEIGSWRLPAILFGWLRCSSGEPRVPFWFGLVVWWGDHFLFEIGSQLLGSSFGFGLFWYSFGAPEVERWWKLIDL